MAQRISRLGWTARVAASVGALALGFAGVGTAGALPGEAQLVFDDAVAAVMPIAETDSVESEQAVDDALDDGSYPVGSEEFSTWVRQGAQDPDKAGREFGAAVSQQARELRDEKAAKHDAKHAAKDASKDAKHAAKDASKDAKHAAKDASKDSRGEAKNAARDERRSDKTTLSGPPADRGRPSR